MTDNLVYKCWIPVLFPSQNEVLTLKSSRYRGKWNTVKKSLEAVVRMAAKYSEPLPVKPYKVVLTYHEWDGRRDLDNIGGGSTKPALDALQTVGLIRNDGRKFIVEIVERYRIAKDVSDCGFWVEFYEMGSPPDLTVPVERLRMTGKKKRDVLPRNKRIVQPVKKKSKPKKGMFQ